MRDSGAILLHIGEGLNGVYTEMYKRVVLAEAFE